MNNLPVVRKSCCDSWDPRQRRQLDCWNRKLARDENKCVVTNIVFAIPESGSAGG